MDGQQQKVMMEILREMLQVAFERVGNELLRRHPELTEEQVRAEARRLTSIYLENFDMDRHEFDLEMIQRMCGGQFNA